MKSKGKTVKKKNISVAEFYKHASVTCGLEVVAGDEWMESRNIIEGAINRPGLALTGFYEYFAWKRIQILGFAEDRYLASLSAKSRKERLKEFFSRKIPCVVIARSKKASPEMLELAGKYKVPVFRTKMVTKHFINDATVLLENLVAPTEKIQGTMIELMGIGVLIEGRPGVGKSDTALSLVKNGAALVSDDITQLRLDTLSGALIGSAINVTRYHMEIKGVGIIHVPSLFGVAAVRPEKVLNLIVTLSRDDKSDDGTSVDGAMPTRCILGVEVPVVKVTIQPGRHIANVVEVATLNYKLKMLGHDAAKELDTRLMDAMTGGRGVYR